MLGGNGGEHILSDVVVCGEEPCMDRECLGDAERDERNSEQIDVLKVGDISDEQTDG